MTLYVYASDGSWAPAEDTVVIEVPQDMIDAEEIEEFLNTYESDPAPISVAQLYIGRRTPVNLGFDLVKDT